MGLGTAVETAIGLALIYLFLSLMTTTANEALAAFLQLRGKQLRSGLEELLKTDASAAGPSLAQQVIGHALVMGTGSKGLPSYVPSRNFALALLDVLADGSGAPVVSQVKRGIAKLPDGPARDALQTLATHAGGDLDALRDSIGVWFDNAMDRVSGVYRRNSLWVSFGIGFVLAVGLNVNTFETARTLYTSGTARDAALKLADVELAHGAPGQTPPAQPSQTPAAPSASPVQHALAALDQLPIGWSCTPPAHACAGASGDLAAANVVQQILSVVWPPRAATVQILLGWLITAFAVSLGAPFWFDLLQQLFNLRAAGPKPVAARTKGSV